MPQRDIGDPTYQGALRHYKKTCAHTDITGGDNMPTGRKPKLTLVQDKVPHRSNAYLAARKNNEPSGCAANFKPPAELSKGARKEWRRIIELYKQLDSGILNDLDMALLSAYCESVAMYKEAQNGYQAPPFNGSLVSMKNGILIENPFMKIMTREGQNIAKYAEQLCLSPVGRARMGVAKTKNGENDDPLTRAGFGDV